MPDKAKEEEDIINDFEKIKDNLTCWGKFVDANLMQILCKFTYDKRLQIYPKYRIKDSQSYMRKVLYERNYADPLLETEDKVGTRAVFLTTNDVIEAKKIIEGTNIWECKIGKDYRDELYNNPNFFGYQSLHLIVSPSNGYPEEPNIYPYLTCEIQLRTLLQHTYAEIAHDGVYKGPHKGDKQMLRVLAKSMALMETTDDHFCNIFDMMADEKRTYKIFFRELTNMFKVFMPDYEYDPAFIEINDTLLSLLLKKDVPLDTLKEFVKNDDVFLRSGIKQKNGLLFKQPAILLVAFYLRKYKYFLNKEWPLSHESLENVFKSFGVAQTQY